MRCGWVLIAIGRAVSVNRCCQVWHHLMRTLTAREKEVFPLVTAGLMNKQIAAKLGVSEITVKVHRGNAMRKMDARSLADLVRMANLLGI